MRRFFGHLLAAASLFLLPVSTPLYAQDWVDGTHVFEEQTRWLAENQTKETLAEYDLRTKGIVQYADRKPLQVGDVQTFNTFNIAAKKNEQVAAVLKRIGTHCYIWVEKGRNVSSSAIERTAKVFDEKIYPTNNAYFGKEWTPGIDGDPRIYLLFLDVRDGYSGSGKGGFVAGYFNSGDEYARAKNPSSNEHEMLYLDINPGNPDKEHYLSVVAHEFQHMIHWHHDPKEFTWVNESMSQLASFLNGFNHPTQVLSFMQGGDNNMLAWSPENMLSNYGQVYLFSFFVMKTFAQTAKEQSTVTRFIVESDQSGTRGYLAALKKIKEQPLFKTIFRDFCVTNFLNDQNSPKGRHSYYPQLQKFLLKPMKVHNEQPYSGKGVVRCWSARAVKMNLASCEGQIRVKFQGQKQVGDKYANDFDVAAVFLDSKKKIAPVVEWLNVKNFAVDQIPSQTAGRHDTLMLVIVNTGPTNSEAVENTFAKNAPPADFAYAVGVSRKGTATRIAANQNRRVSRRTAYSMMEAITQRADLLSDITNNLVDDDSVQASVENPLVSEFNRWEAEEQLLADSVQHDLAKGDTGILEDFRTIYQASSGDSNKKLLGLKQRLNDLVRFEIMQNGREELKAFLID